MRHIGQKKGMTGLMRAIACSIGGGIGLLLIAGTPIGLDRQATSPTIQNAGSAAGPDGGACIDRPDCIERYLWSVYQRTPKIEAGGADFTWKDAEAAEKAGLSLRDYVVRGMDPFFRVTLYRALRTLDLAGFRPGLMCGFRDDYRQSITTGRMKARNDHSFHGGSFRGGYGYGLAADVVSLRGRTVSERSDATARMWDWIDRHEEELGIGRPYLRRDPPHVAPIDGEEYAAHRLLPDARGAVSRALRRRPPAAPAGENARPGAMNPAADEGAD